MTDPSHFIEWARKSLVPLSTVSSSAHWDELQPFGEMIGDAAIVALSEAVHCGVEPLEFRNRLLEFLVREKGFTAIAIESGIVESRIIHDYVRDGVGDLDTAVAEGLSWTFDRLPQNRVLIEWMRQFNADTSHRRKINFYGFDVAGSPGIAPVRNGVSVALIKVLAFLRDVDTDAHREFHARLAALMPQLRFSLSCDKEGAGYEALSQSARDALTAIVTELIALVERKESVYAKRSSTAEYGWAHRGAIACRQVDSWLRHVPLEWQAPRVMPERWSSEINFLSAAMDVRDRAQADNLDWIMRQEGPLGKILVFASRYHLSAVSVKAGYRDNNGDESEQQVAGTYLDVVMERDFSQLVIASGLCRMEPVTIRKLMT